MSAAEASASFLENRGASSADHQPGMADDNQASIDGCRGGQGMGFDHDDTAEACLEPDGSMDERGSGQYESASEALDQTDVVMEGSELEVIPKACSDALDQQNPPSGSDRDFQSPGSRLITVASAENPHQQPKDGFGSLVTMQSSTRLGVNNPILPGLFSKSLVRQASGNQNIHGYVSLYGAPSLHILPDSSASATYGTDEGTDENANPTALRAASQDAMPACEETNWHGERTHHIPGDKNCRARSPKLPTLDESDAAETWQGRGDAKECGVSGDHIPQGQLAARKAESNTTANPRNPSNPQGAADPVNKYIFQLHWDKAMTFAEIAKHLEILGVRTSDRRKSPERTQPLWTGAGCNNRYNRHAAAYLQQRGILHVSPADVKRARPVLDLFGPWASLLTWVVQDFNDNDQMNVVLRQCRGQTQADARVDWADAVGCFEAEAKWALIKVKFLEAAKVRGPRSSLGRCVARDDPAGYGALRGITATQYKCIYACLLNKKYISNDLLSGGDHSGLMCLHAVLEPERNKKPAKIEGSDEKNGHSC